MSLPNSQRSQDLQAKEVRLSEIKAKLKAKFVGIDEVIEQLIEYVRIWYLIPQLMTRPMIINLWGMTGVGKTDLIRTLVKELDFQDKFAEIELSGQYKYFSDVQDILQHLGIYPGQQNIILFDEFQNFRSKDEQGKEIKNEKFNDFWQLLSDGKMSRQDDLFETERVMAEIMGMQEDDKVEDKGNGGGRRSRRLDDKIDFWEVVRLKKELKLPESLVTLANMTYNDLFSKIKQIMDSKKAYENLFFNQSLIFVSGNLDEAYVQAKQAGEVEIDADIFRSFTEKISLVDIKEALGSRFRPEQISRLGNMHLIYKSLSKADYQEIIRRSTESVRQRVSQNFGIELELDESLYHLIYRNGVFPVQGVRPVFSSVTDILETNLAPWLIECIFQGKKSIHLSYNNTKKQLEAVLETDKPAKRKNEHKPEGEPDEANILTKPFVASIDKARISHTFAEQWRTAIHESGHALAYMSEFALAPLQLKSRLASTYAAGFTFPHRIQSTKENIKSQIRILLAGTVAEGLILGEDKRSIGHEKDLEEATELASKFVRQYGFADTLAVTAFARGDEYHFNTDLTVSNARIEDIIQEEMAQIKQTLEENEEFLQELSKKLLKAGSLNPQQIKRLALKYGLVCKVEGEGYVIG
jgi:Peptidase family M41/C-terminal, D2-small domain, of ClpB protein/ATPase family associated with various cellular activities (AAA)